MKTILVLSILCLQTLAFADALPFSGKILNSSEPDAVYHTADHPDALFVLVFTCNDLDVSATPCSYNEKAENVMAAKYAAEPRIQIIDIADVNEGESTDGYMKFIDANQVNHPVVLDRGGRILAQYLHLGFLQVAFPPFTYVVSPQGKVLLASHQLWTAKTFNDPTITLGEAIEKLIRQHLEQP